MSKTVVEAHGEFVEMDETVVGTDSDVAGTDGAVVGTDGDVAGTLGDFVGRPGDAMETGDFRFEGLTPSDCGRLPEATRKVLVQLLRGPYVSQERHSKNWATLLRAETELRERLGDLFLELVVDTDAGIAFVRNMESDEVELPRVIRSQRLTLIDTGLVLFLREQLLNVEASGRRVFVGYTDIVDQMSVYRNVLQIDEAGFGKRVRTSIDKMKAQSVLLPTAEDDRFEVSPILRLVFDADQVIAVTREVRRLLAENDDGTSGAPDILDAADAPDISAAPDAPDASGAPAVAPTPDASAAPSTPPVSTSTSIAPIPPQYDTEDR